MPTRYREGIVGLEGYHIVLLEEAWLEDSQAIVVEINRDGHVIAVAQLIPEELVDVTLLNATHEDHRVVLRMSHNPLDQLLRIDTRGLEALLTDFGRILVGIDIDCDEVIGSGLVKLLKTFGKGDLFHALRQPREIDLGTCPSGLIGQCNYLEPAVGEDEREQRVTTIAGEFGSIAAMETVGKAQQETRHLVRDGSLLVVSALHAAIGIVRELLFDHFRNNGIGKGRMHTEALAMLQFAHAF